MNSPVLVLGQYIDSYLPAVDGVVVTVQNYARHLNRAPQSSCYVASSDPPRGYQDSTEFPVIRYHSVPVFSRPPYRFGIPLLDMEFMATQHHLVPNLVHAHSPFAAGLEALRMARMRRIPLVASFHSKYYDDIYAATGNRILAERAVEIIVAFYRQADAVWTVNRGTAGTLRDYGYQGEITIMPNGTDFSPPDDPAQARLTVCRRYQLDASKPILLFVGQQILQKNLMMILEACRIMKDQRRSFSLLLVGEGNATDALKARCNQLGLQDEVTFAGPEKDRARLCEIYTAADLFVFPSVYDNAPLVVREAAMAECPSVMVAGSNAAEDCRDGVDAYLCQAQAQSLAGTLIRALDDPQRALVGLQAREHLALPWEQVVQRVLAQYHDLLDAWPRS